MRKLNSTNIENEEILEIDCPFMLTLRFIGKRWKPAVLWKINDGYIRFKDLKKQLPGISDKMLSQTVSELTRDGILKKRIYEEVPLRVEYGFTDFGKTLLPVLSRMNEWGNANLI
ncbi:MAG: helix-turn-helix domain-containing protein [Bacteroidota bacterium]